MDVAGWDAAELFAGVEEDSKVAPYNFLSGMKDALGMR